MWKRRALLCLNTIGFVQMQQLFGSQPPLVVCEPLATVVVFACVIPEHVSFGISQLGV